jgi:hypothetical protein
MESPPPGAMATRVSDQFSMREQHRLLLMRHRVYLLHNLRPTEELWSTLIANEVLSPQMVQEIKVSISGVVVA